VTLGVRKKGLSKGGWGKMGGKLRVGREKIEKRALLMGDLLDDRNSRRNEKKRLWGRKPAAKNLNGGMPRSDGR